jgi:hypothetical protein
LAAVPGTLLAARLRNQQLIETRRRKPADVVSALCAMQAQDFSAAKWAIGMRAGCLDMDVEQAFNDGLILRTHVLRPTWHFVAPADIRWLLAVTAPRVHATNAYYYRQAGLDAKVFAKSCAVIHRALDGGAALTRAELAEHLHRAKVPAAGLKLAYVVMHAELEGVICSGPRRGKEFTYMLLSDRAPHARPLDREHALAELARRYFASHGPATVRDFSWWCGLTAKDAQQAIDLAGLDCTDLDGLAYWSAGRIGSRTTTAAALLLPNYDEYLVAYRDRAAVIDPTRAANVVARSGGAIANHLVIDGRLAGGWSRTVKGNTVVIEVSPYKKLSPAHVRAVRNAVDCYGEFLGLPASLALV